MANLGLPEKILVIKDCTFILPSDFDGTIEDAFDEFLKYRKENLSKASYVDRHGLFSTFNLLLHSHSDNVRVCGEYMLYKLENGEYKIIGGTIPGQKSVSSEEELIKDE